MDTIKLGDKEYPIRFDMKALKEYKAKTKNDILVKLDQSTENIIALAYVGIKAGMRFTGQDAKDLTEEKISEELTIGDLPVLVNILMSQIGAENLPAGELKPS